MLIFSWYFVYETKGLNELQTRLLYTTPAIRLAREKLFAGSTLQGTVASPTEEGTLNPETAEK